MKYTILLCTVLTFIIGVVQPKQYSREELIGRDRERREAALKQSEDEFHKEMHLRQEELLKAMRKSRPKSVQDKPTDPRDRAAMEALYQSTNGAKWLNNSGWMQGDPCTYPYWYGLYCLEGRILEIDLAYNGLDGDIPSELAQVTALQAIRIYSNVLTGEIPHGLFVIQSLQIIDFNTNSISGTLPSVISMVNLTQLAFYGNKIKSVFPTTFEAPKLQTLDVSDNLITGHLPDGIGDSILLTDLVVSRNMLRGDLPTSFGNLVKLQRLWTFYNELDDPVLPNEYQSMTELLNVQMDSLSGPFPSWIGDKWSKVQYLVLIDGQLSGNLPSSICHLQEVTGFRVFNNSLTGQLPDCICSMKKLTDFEASDNTITGNIPDNFDDCKLTESLFLSRNNLTGKFPASVGRMASLSVLDVSSNGLYGTIPNSINGLKDTIANFAVCFNMFSDVEPGLAPFFKRIVDYSCLFYNNPWSCPLSETIPSDCSASCSDCNAKQNRSCSACVAKQDCGWCGMGQNCLDGSSSAPGPDYKCPMKEWKFQQC